MSQDRIIHLQKSLRIARKALERIHHGSRDPERIASDALDALFQLEPKQPLQGVVGHDRTQGMDALRAAAKIVAVRRGSRF
jgi:hypothetical protein